MKCETCGNKKNGSIRTKKAMDMPRMWFTMD